MSLIKVNNLATLDGAASREVTANTGLTIPAGEDLKVSGSIIDSTGSDGNTGQYLTATNNGLSVTWTSLPQSIATTANVTFNSVTVTGDITIGGTANFTLTGFTTSDLTEGSNLYYTNARARGSISAQNSGSGDGSISYNNNTGVLTYTGPDDADYRSAFSAANTPDTTSADYLGSLSYSSTNGRFTYTGPTVQEIRTKISRRNVSGLGSIGYDSTIGEITYVGPSNAEIRNLFSAGGDLAYNAATGQFFIDLETSGGSDILNIVSNGPLTDLVVNNASAGKSITSVVVSGTTGTVNSTNHGFVAGDRISITGNANAHVNKIYQVQTAATNSFTVTVSNVDPGTYTGGLARPIAVFTGDVVIDGTINVNGTNIGLSDLFVGTSLIKLNSDLPDGAIPSIEGDDDAYIQVNRGAYNDTALRWNELSRRWQFTNDGINYNNILLPSETDFGASEEFGASGDPLRYNVASITNVTEGAFTYKKVVVPDVSKFKPNHRVKVFGVSQTQNLSTANPTPTAPSIVTPSYESALFNDIANYPHQFYGYAIAQMDLQRGDISAAVVQSVAAIENLSVSDLNESNYNTVTVTRSANKAILLYRATFNDLPTATSALGSFAANAANFKLIAVIGPRYFGSSTNTYQYVDYGSYDVARNSLRNDDGSFGPNQVHVPHTASVSSKQGFITCGIRPGSINEAENSFVLDVPTLYNDSNINNIFMYHDDTTALQTAINEAVNTGRNFLVIPGGTYLVSQLELPDRFTLRGLADATVLHKQYWDTNRVFDNTKIGAKGAMLVGADYDFSVAAINPVTGENNWGVIDNFLGDIIFDGSTKYQILNETSPLGADANDAVLNFVNSEFMRIQNVKVRQSAGPALYATGSENLTVDGCVFYDGADLERFSTPCIVAQEGDTTVVTNSIFRDFPGPVDFSSTTVLSVNGCTIRNCSSGLRIYGSSKTDVLNNLILGPSDEYIPVPDLYDSEFNSVNLQVQYGINNPTPVFQYIVSGQEIDLTNAVKRIEAFRVTVSNGNETIDYQNPITAADGSDLFGFLGINSDPSIGQVQFEMSVTNSNYLIENFPSIPNAYNVYRVYGVLYFDYGSDIAPSVTTGTTITLAGGAKAYVIGVNQTAYNSVINGSYIKLVSHSFSPAPPVSDRIWEVIAKENLGAGNYSLTLSPRQEDAQGNITTTTLTGVGTEPTVGGGYIQVRDKFIIAKGIISVSL